ncbi:DNA topoisomerase IV [Aquiflexum lacus]|uniref:DNA topoisomerase IV n=1 Tax=Aquiflexum lacus TaxID=2483805 RepID=UPI00189450E9|nr:DNA topoisomerase IV [Aquiflexum lacus]
MYYRFGKVFHFLTVLVFIFVFLYTYSALPDQVAYEIDSQGAISKIISKNTFFYIGIILFVVLNIILITPGKLIENQSTKNIKRLFSIGDVFRDYMLTWIYSFVGIINISLCIMSIFVHSINNQNEISSGEFNFFFYLIPVFFVVWIVGLFWILLKKFKSLQSN